MGCFETLWQQKFPDISFENLSYMALFCIETFWLFELTEMFKNYKICFKRSRKIYQKDVLKIR